MTRLKKAKEIAESQFELSQEISTENMIQFNYKGVDIVNPWIDENGDKDFTTEQAIEHYGKENIERFINECNK